MLKLFAATSSGQTVAYEASNELPSGEGGQTGEIASAAYFRALTAALNQASVHNSCQPVSQAWPGGDCVSVGAELIACVWRVPLAASTHNILRLVVRAEGIGAGAAVKLESEGSGIQKTVVFNGEETKIIDLQIDQGAKGFGVYGDYDEITMTLVGTPGSVTVFSIDSAYRPPASVLNSQNYLKDGTPLQFLRVGTNVIQDESSISSLLGHVTRENVLSLRSRRRSLGCWSAVGVDSSQTSVGWWGVGRHNALTMIQPGTVAADETLKIHVRTINTTNDVQRLFICLTEPGNAATFKKLIEIPANQDATWSEHEMPLSETGRIPSPRRPLTPEPCLWLGVDTSQLTTRALLGLSAWAE